MLVLAFILLTLAIILFWQASRRQHSAGLPGGKIIYEDTRNWGQTSEPLYDPVLGITGKPDYLVEKGDHIIPVEVKSSRPPSAPYDSHIYQLAVYCLLVQRVFKKKPPYGILHYAHPSNASRTYAIDFTAELENATLDLIAQIRQGDRKKELDRSHQETARCLRCGYRSVCDQKIS
jgi:CRISPR-associated exonuclease Cas4